MKKCKHMGDYCQKFMQGKNSVIRFKMIFMCRGYSKKCGFYEPAEVKDGK